ncbi:Armadillo repeat-containing protein 4 [Dissostichus eleginoides]|uniref:Armadillo repeat-containing protein 4 n=1 Tax=Dissostichus eleginoides TaxID=100907 RepID=A0AAD9BNA0_DISEL|nr:Armadillo repeat-containing protein 4 [Dissostichus eleginoides]
MGLSLTRAAQWTPASSGTGKLESTPMNESLLKEILSFAEQFGSQHPQEALHVFQEPLQWSTTLVASDFKTDYDISDSDVQSNERDSEGLPLLQLSPPTVSVRSFNQLSKLVHLAEDKKVEEVQACLEENRYPVVKILGSSVASILQGEDTDTDVLSLLLSKCLEEIAGKIRLDPTAVKNEVDSLKQSSIEREKRVLKSIRYTSDYIFSNGCRAPPWRQVHGEMCYLVIEPCDTETLCVTCSTAGVFLNGGVKQEGEESGYERTSDVYRDLRTLLKSRSPHFAEKINTQDFAVQEASSTQKVQHVEPVDADEQGQPQRSYEQREKNVHENARQSLYKTGGEKKYEPCPRWRNLGLTSPCGEAEEKKRSKSSGEEKSDEIQKKKLGAGAKGKMKAEFSASSLPGRLSSQKIAVKFETSCILYGSPSAKTRYFQLLLSYTELYEALVVARVHLSPGGDQTATVLTLCAMMDFNLMQETCQLAIRDVGGLEVLINLLDTDEVKCKIGSLKILRKISHNVQIRRAIVDMGGLQSIVRILDSPVKDLKALAAETISNVARFRRARRTVRQYGGIKKLVKLLDCVPNLASLSANQEKDVEVARCGALALWSCSKSTKNKEAIRKAGGIPLLGRLLKSPHENMLIPVVGTLQECASEESYRIAIQTEGMIKDLVKNLSSDNDELQMHCASAIFKCAEGKQTRDLVREYKGLQPLASLLSKASNKQLLAAATGAIWKCSISMENVAKFQEYKALETLVGLLTDQPEEVLVNVVGAVGEFARIPANKAIIRKCGGITSLALLVNVTNAVGACATDMDNMAIIDQLDGVRLVWSLLKNPSAEVQSSAAWALCPCINNAKIWGPFQAMKEILASLSQLVA